MRACTSSDPVSSSTVSQSDWREEWILSSEASHILKIQGNAYLLTANREKCFYTRHFWFLFFFFCRPSALFFVFQTARSERQILELCRATPKLILRYFLLRLSVPRARLKIHPSGNTLQNEQIWSHLTEELQKKPASMFLLKSMPLNSQHKTQREQK